MMIVEIDEYSTCDEVIPLAVAAEVARVSRGALSVAGVTPAGARLQATSHVGVVATDDIEVRIRPKVPHANVLGMLVAATRLVAWLDGQAGVSQQDDLLRSTVGFFARSLADVLGSGIQRDYIEHHEALTAPRGRLDFAALARGGGLPSPLPCDFDEFSEDTVLNRYLVAAVNCCLRVRGLNPPVRRLLRHARAAFVSVPAVPVAADAIERHHFTRLDDRYRPAAALARLVLERISLHHSTGDSTVRAFTVDMNQLFESWVAARLPAHLPAGVQLDAQSRRHFDAAEAVPIRPDLEVQVRGRPVYVADTKYKLTSSGLARIGDYYQALAYATVLGLPEAMLIYCDDGGHVPPREIEVKGSGTLIRTHSMSLRGSAAELEDEVARLAQHITARQRHPVAA